MEKSKVQKKEKVKKTNIQKRDRLVFITILAIIVIAIIVVVFVVNKNNKSGTINQDGTTNTVDSAQQANTENVTVKDDGTKENVSAQLKAEKTFEGLTINEIGLSSNSGLTKFTAKIENKSETDFTGKPVKIVFVNKAGEEVSTLEAYVGDTKAGQFSYMDASITSDLSNAYDFSIVNK